MSLDVDRIGAVVAAAKGASDELMAIIDGLTPLATQNSRNLIVFDHEELQIRIGMSGRFARLIECLEQIEPLKLAVAPIVSALFSTDETDVLVLRYWAIPGEQRLAFDRPRPKDTARLRFRDDLLELANSGWMHEWAMRGTLYWRVGSKTETMVLEEWSVMQPIENKDEVVAMLSRIA